jgi:hypothetical protein
MAAIEIWTYAIETPTVDLAGFKVEARDGSIGKVDEATNAAGGSFIVVDTGPWIFGKHVMIPAGFVTDIDLDAQTIDLGLTKDEIKNAPEFDKDRYLEQDYRTKLGSYYRDRSGSQGR